MPDYDKQIREEIKMRDSDGYRAAMKKLKALEHGDAEMTDEALFDTTTFGARDQEALLGNTVEIPDTTGELNGVLDLRQRDANPQIA